MAFILSVAIPLLFERKLQLMVYLAENPNIPLSSEQAMESLGVSMAVAFLCWQAPTMAAGLMSGMGAGLSASSLSQTREGMSQMSSSIANSGGGAGVGNMMHGISVAIMAGFFNNTSYLSSNLATCQSSFLFLSTI